VAFSSGSTRVDVPQQDRDSAEAALILQWASMKTVAICVIGITMIALAVWHRPDDADDFGPFYRAAGLSSAHLGVYSSPTLSPQTNSEGKYLPYLRIPFYAMVLRPLTAMPYATARRVWIGLSVLAVFACVWLFPQERNRLAIALAFSFPLADDLMVGQDICLVLLIVVAAARIYQDGQEFLAGLVASLLGIKVTYLPAAGIVFLARSRRGTWGFLTGSAIEFVLSFPAGGAGWVSEFLTTLRSPLLDIEPQRMLNIRAVTESLSMPAVVYIVAGAVLYVCFWFACKRLSVTDGLMAALALGLIAAPHSKVYDGVVLIPLLVRAASLYSWEGLLAYLALMPGFYLMVLMGKPPAVLAGSAILVLSAVAATWRQMTANNRQVTVPTAMATP
jgi:hypothetical protein